jgi:two-component system, chemotaxis family, sensor kinase CheA
MSFDTQNYIELFYQDAEEHLQLMTDALLDMERNPADKEALAAVFRSAHTMKSSSAMVGFMHISEFTHRMEDMISHFRDNDVTITTDMVDILFRSFDVLKEMLTQLQDESAEAQRNQTKTAAQDLMKVFAGILTGDDPVEEPEEKKPDAYSVRIKLDEEHRTRIEELRLSGEKIFEMTIHFSEDVQMAATRAYLIVNNLSKIATTIQTNPDLDDDSQTVGFLFSLIVASKENSDQLTKMSAVSEVDKVDIRDVTDIDQFEWPDENKPAEVVEETVGETVDEDAPEEESKQDKAVVTSSFDRREDKAKVQTVRVNIEKLDRLLNLAAEMVIQRGRAYELSQQLVIKNGKGGLEEEIFDAINQQGMFLSQLQEIIMEARMIPIGMVFSRFRRVIRDLAHARNKKVNLVMEGEETELDKKIIDQIGEPLMHMVRNSVDHGLETEEDRLKAGKPAEGLLHLNAIHQGNNIVISIMDDGAGIDAEKLKGKAVEKGIITPDEAAAMPKKEALHLIFRPGFSTAKTVTDISGRGVGMDVVRRSIDNLGGTVEIETELGKGTTFLIKLPLTLAIIQALLVESDKEIFALPISSISETIRISPDEIFSVKGSGKVIRLREEVIPILNLRSVVTGDINGELDEKCYVAILKNGNQYAGLIVDRMVNEQEVVIKSLSGDFPSASYISGAAILGNGQVILILDIPSLIDQTLGSYITES